MNLLLLSPDELLPDGTARVQGRRARHVAEVLRAGPGDKLRAGVLGESWAPPGSWRWRTMEPIWP